MSRSQGAGVRVRFEASPKKGQLALLLPRLMRADVMKRLIYTGEVFAAEQAEGWGLVTEIAEDPLARAQAIASDIAGKSPSAVVWC